MKLVEKPWNTAVFLHFSTAHQTQISSYKTALHPKQMNFCWYKRKKTTVTLTRTVVFWHIRPQKGAVLDELSLTEHSAIESLFFLVVGRWYYKNAVPTLCDFSLESFVKTKAREVNYRGVGAYEISGVFEPETGVGSRAKNREIKWVGFSLFTSYLFTLTSNQVWHGIFGK